MAQGKKYNDDLKEQAFALLSVNNSVQYVAEQLGVPRSTVSTWKIALDKKIKEGNLTNDEVNLVKLRQKKKEEFIEQSWNNIELASKIIHKKLMRAYFKEDELDLVLEEALKETAGSDRRKVLVNNIASMKLDDIGKISTTMGTLYDKQALANGEATSREEQIVSKFEDYWKNDNSRHNKKA